MSDGHDYTDGGDPVCWLNRVCDECGAFREDTGSPVCARCGTAFPDAENTAAHSDSGARGHAEDDTR